MNGGWDMEETIRVLQKRVMELGVNHLEHSKLIIRLVSIVEKQAERIAFLEGAVSALRSENA